MNNKIIITKDLHKAIYKQFKKESREIYALFDTLKDNPNKGKLLSVIGNIILKELQYNNYRFYFIQKQEELILLKQEELKELLIIFLAMSTKNKQQETIDAIKDILKQWKSTSPPP